MKSELAAWLVRAKRLEWRLEEASPDTVVFYQLSEGAAALSKLQERLKGRAPLLLVLNRKPVAELGVATLVVDAQEWMPSQALAADHFFPLPPGLRVFAVTGTNGKTTTVDLVLQLAGQGGFHGFSVGTLGVRTAAGTQEEFGLTTPGYLQLRSILNRYGKGADFCVMEASSHALVQDRMHGLKFEAAAWTSFSQDHLDYHKTMDEYFKAKSLILEKLVPGGTLFVPHRQGDILRRLPAAKPTRELGVLLPRLPAFFSAAFNQENLECARELVRVLGVDERKVLWERLQPPPGRFFAREWDGRMAVVDFAHTPDAVENICKAIKESFPSKKLIVLFGCGGDRDRTKRPLMGQAAARWADEIILTSDNPRSEKPEQIIQDIFEGIKTFRRVKQEADRPRAVREALGALAAGEILLMAGKGHEDYIQIGQTKHPYSDIGEVETFLRNRKP